MRNMLEQTDLGKPSIQNGGLATQDELALHTQINNIVGAGFSGRIQDSRLLCPREPRGNTREEAMSDSPPADLSPAEINLCFIA